MYSKPLFKNKIDSYSKPNYYSNNNSNQKIYSLNNNQLINNPKNSNINNFNNNNLEIKKNPLLNPLHYNINQKSEKLLNINNNDSLYRNESSINFFKNKNLVKNEDRHSLLINQNRNINNNLLINKNDNNFNPLDKNIFQNSNNNLIYKENGNNNFQNGNNNFNQKGKNNLMNFFDIQKKDENYENLLNRIQPSSLPIIKREEFEKKEKLSLKIETKKLKSVLKKRRVRNKNGIKKKVLFNEELTEVFEVQSWKLFNVDMAKKLKNRPHLPSVGCNCLIF